MFGYIGPEKSELKVKDLALYQAFYCGLCRTLGARYGQAARAVLSYDSAFIALLVSGLTACPGCEEHWCLYKPMRKKQPMAKPSPALDYAADMNLLLTWYKLRDNWADERSGLSAAGAFALKAAKAKAQENAPVLCGAIENGIEELSALEKANCRELDAPADAFARMMRGMLACAPVGEGEKRAVSALGFHMGRWVYLMDAWDDRKKDEKKGVYNPFLASGADAARAGFLLNCSLNEAIKAYELLDIRAHKAVLDNIFYEGCVNSTRKLLNDGGDHEQQSL